MHQLAEESTQLLENGDLAKYSNDAHETVQSLAKKICNRASARGNVQNRQKHPTQVIIEHHTMLTHLWSTVGPHGQLQITRSKSTEKEYVPVWLL